MRNRICLGLVIYACVRAQLALGREKVPKKAYFLQLSLKTENDMWTNTTMTLKLIIHLINRRQNSTKTFIFSMLSKVN